MLTPEMNHIIDRLEYFRNSHGFSKSELAKYLNIPRFTIRRWETGESKISPAMIRVLKSIGII